jgi:uncharacterized protein (PEP-CTERM system associated)
VALSYAGALASMPALADNWTVTPSATVTETYTNNVNLGPSGRQESNWVTSVTGAIAISGAGARTRLNGTAALQGVLYSGQQSDKLYGQVNLLGNIEAIEKFFYVDGAVSVSQQYLSPFAPQPADNVGVTNNRYTSTGYRVSPYIQGVLPGGVTYLVRNDNIWSDPSGTSAATASSYVNSWVARIDSPIRTFGWSIDVNTNYTKFSNAADSLSNQIVRGILHYQPDPQLRLDAIGGYERNDYATTSDNIVYGAGGEWKPSDRTVIAGDWQERFFGSSYLVLFTHRNPYTAFNINASRNITTYPQLLFALPAGTNVAALVDAAFTTRIPDPTQRAQAVQAFLTQTGLPPTLQSPLNFYAEQVTLYDQQSATFTIFGVRNATAFTIYNRKSEAISGASGQPLPPPFGAQTNNTQRGGSITFSHRLTPFTSLNATATYYETIATAPFTGKSSTDYFSVVLGTRLSAKTSANTGLTYTIFDSNVTNDYNAFTAYVSLNHNF